MLNESWRCDINYRWDGDVSLAHVLHFDCLAPSTVAATAVAAAAAADEAAALTTVVIHVATSGRDGKLN